MAVGLSLPGQLLPVDGVRLAAGRAGIKASAQRDDLVLIEINDNAAVAAVFTRNRFCAAPVVVARRHLESATSIRYLLINSGNANAGTGTRGEHNALASCEMVADVTGSSVTGVLPFSTGVIGQQLPVERIRDALPSVYEKLAADNWLAAANGIMTTDTMPKAVSRQINIDGNPVTITGISKGSGMIKPDMATMLAYIATDAAIAKDQLSACLERAVEVSFNSISVDGDTSTNDACVLIATGKSGVSVDESHAEFVSALIDVFQHLAHSIIRDGEGATKFVEIRVDGADSKSDARALAYTIAHSPLVKTALFASDANWGRILAAIGRAPVDGIDIGRIDLFLGEVCLIKGGLPDPDYREQRGQAEMSKQDIVIRVDLNQGAYSTVVWTTDLSYDYVKINAEYRS